MNMNGAASEMGVLIFGAGIGGLSLVPVLERSKIEVLAFLDNYKPEGSVWLGKKIYRPSAALENIAAHTPVIVSLRGLKYSPETLKDELKALGWENVFTLAEFLRHNYARFGDIYWRTEPGYYEQPKRLEIINRVRDIWADAKSFDLFSEILRFRKNFDEAVFSMPPSEDEYYPADIPGVWPSPIRLVDCGAFDGDTLRLINSRDIRLEAAALFEADIDNFKRLIDFCAGYDPSISLFCWPCAVSDIDGVLYFNFNKDIPMGSSLNGACSDAQPVHCVRLDSAIKGFGPTLIKIDVEGAEPLVLKGAKKILNKYRPGWAVCLYHNVDDLWEIPYFFIRYAYSLGYKYYLRRHAWGCFDDYCFYAVPQA